VTTAETELWPQDLYGAEEVFITSTTRELVPVTRSARESDSVAVGGGRPGPVTTRLLEAFRARALEAVGAERQKPPL